MMIVDFLIFLYSGYIIVFYIFLLQRDLFGDEKYNFISKDDIPFVTILVSVRNEEDIIDNLLKSLELLTYPKDRYEILIGDDRSEDKTVEIIKSYAEKISNLTLIESVNALSGKAKTINNLAQNARGDYFFITDADCVLPQNIIENYIKYFSDNVGIVSGGVFGIQNTLFSRIQSIDLIYSKGLIADLSNLNINITAIGLNMVISREAYFLAMNYIDDTNLVEDYDLSQKVLNNGLKLINVLEPETTIKTKTKSSIKDFFEQRNRWMYGFKKISLNLKSLFVSIYMFYPLTLILIIFKYNYLWLILIIVVSLRFLLFTRYSKRISKSDFNKYFLLYEIVMNILYVFIFFHSFISRDISWKNRKYKI